MKYYLGIDQGTTGVTALLFDTAFAPVARGYSEIKQFYPAPGLVEHDPENIWQAVQTATAEAMKKCGAVPGDILAIGIDHEGESVALWDRDSGEPVYPAIVWQDNRTAARAAELARLHGKRFLETAALLPDSYFSATKIEWILQNVPRARELLQKGSLLAGNMDAYILWKMTGGRTHATDASTASRTLLYDIGRGCFDEELSALCGVPTSILPTVGDSARAFGNADPRCFLDICAPITALLNDQQAALLGQGCLDAGTLKTTYGTGCFMLMNTGDAPILSKNGLLTTVAWQLNGKRTYALDGGIYIAGAATQWLRDGLGIISSAKETAAMARSLPDNGGLYFVPAFSGLAAPHRDPTATGTMIGISGGTTREHLVRATLESTAYQVVDLAAAMQRDSGISLQRMRCDGGATANDFLMQFQADILGIPLEVPQFADATALGTAFAAAMGAGHCGTDTIAAYRQEATVYEPKMPRELRLSYLDEWHRALERAKGWRV